MVDYLKIIWLLIASTFFFLSLWIIIPAPNLLLIRLSVGVPEISAWLIVIQLLSLILGLINFQANVFFDLIIIYNVIGLGLTLLPIIQFPQVNARFQTQMETGLGKNYLSKIPEAIQAQMRKKPLIVKDLFLGIPQPQVRIDRSIKVANLDGVTLTLNSYKPLSVGKNPSLVVVYGGGWQNGSPDKNEAFSRYIANQGYTVIAIDYRHAPEYQYPTQLYWCNLLMI